MPPRWLVEGGDPRPAPGTQQPAINPPPTVISGVVHTQHSPDRHVEVLKLAVIDHMDRPVRHLIRPTGHAPSLPTTSRLTAMSDDPTFRVLELRCEDCGEHLYLRRFDDPNAVQAKHVQRHRNGKCPLCGHWNDEHHDSSRFPEPVAGWINGPLICGHPTGQGDFCGCGTIREVDPS